MHDDYFEAVLQLRNAEEDIVRDAINRLEGDVATAEHVQNGVDIYVTDQNRAKRVGWDVRDAYGGTVAIDSSLHSIDAQTSKEQRRVRVTVRLSDISPGEFIVVDDRLYEVEQVGKDVKVYDVKHEKTTRIALPEEYDTVTPRQTRVVQVEPDVAVLHPLSYQQVTVRNTGDVVVDEKVTVVDHHGLWLV